MVLQDLINELGRRLDFSVENERYQGIANAVGFDGVWTSPEGRSIVIEVKTTDVYRISLDKIAEYREKLIAIGRIGKSSSILSWSGGTTLVNWKHRSAGQGTPGTYACLVLKRS